MELIVLGSEGGWATPGGAACGYLLHLDGFNLWLDAGTGTMANLQEHIGLRDVDAVVISHRHFDHFLDLYPYFLALRLDQERRGRVPLFAPPGFFEHALQLEAKLGEVFAPAVVEPGATFEAGPIRVRTAPMAHPVPTLGMRFEVDGRALAYSGDTGPCDELVDLARHSDVLLCEATWLERPEGWDLIHLTAAEAGEHAARAEAASLILTHIWPTNDLDKATQQAGAAFGGPAQLAAPGMSVKL